MNHNKKAVKRGFLEKSKRKLDWFGDGFTFRLPDGKKTKKTWTGCFITVFTITAVVLYAGTQYLQLHNFIDPSIMVSQRDAFYTTDHEFSSDEGLQVAFALTAYDWE